MEKEKQNTRKSASFLLEILLDSLSVKCGNQPEAAYLLFEQYCRETYHVFTDFQISTIKNGTRPINVGLVQFYASTPKALQADFRKNLLPTADCKFLAKQFCSIIRRSTRTKNAEKPQIPDNLDQFSPEQCSDFLADTLNFFMVHQDCVLRIGVAAPPPDYILGCRVPAPCEHFCGRDKEIKALHELLLGKGFAFVTGLPGMGKSELSRAYAHVHSQDYASYYQHTMFVSFRHSLRETICAIPFAGDEEIRQRYAKRRDLLLEALSKAPEPNSKWQEELEKLDQACSDEMFQVHDEKFQQMGPDTLLIIDNLDIPSEQEPLLEQVTQYPCNVLFTTRYRYTEYPSLELTEIQDSKVWMALVSCYFPKAKKFSKEIQKMVSLLYGHTLFVELSARLLRMGVLTVPELLDKLRSREWGIDDPVKLRKDGMDHSKTFLEFLRMIFPLFNMAPEEQYILTNLALFPRQGIALTDFKKWLGISQAPEVSTEERNLNKQRSHAICTLEDKGLIQNREGTLFLHDLIREVIGAEEEVAPSIRRCETLLQNLRTLCKKEELEMPEIESVFLTVLNVVQLARKDDEAHYLDFLKDGFCAMVIQGYSSGIPVLAQELTQWLGPTGSPLDLVRTSYIHYVFAATADTIEETVQEYKAALEGVGKIPIEEVLRSPIQPELDSFLDHSNRVLDKCLKKMLGEKGMADLEDKIQKEREYLFQTEKGWAEIQGRFSRFLKMASSTAEKIQSGKQSDEILQNFIDLFWVEKPDEEQQ